MGQEEFGRQAPVNYIIGVDEAGRGPLAGPVAVGVVMVADGFDVAKEFPGVADSKILSEEKREKLFEMLVGRQVRGDARFSVQFASHTAIDIQGIVPSVRSCVARGVRELAPLPEGISIYLDGLLRAPKNYMQETIIDGDALVPIISLASIAAKVSRDRHMKELAKQYPLYGFEKHKGYGTDFHYKKLREFGLCEIHRKSYIHIDFTSQSD